MDIRYTLAGANAASRNLMASKPGVPWSEQGRIPMINGITALVWGSGRVIVGKRGWRAQEASIEALVDARFSRGTLYLPSSAPEYCEYKDVLRQCADRYGVPIVSFAEALKMALEGVPDIGLHT